MRPQLEVLHASPDQQSKKPPLLFVHGAFMSASCWARYFLPWFSGHGYDCHALSLRGHGNSEGREWLALASLDHYCADLQSVVATLPRPPILIGHSMGGLVIQNWLAEHRAPAVALLAAVPPMASLCTLIEMAFNVPCADWGSQPEAADRAEADARMLKLQQLLFSAGTPLPLVQQLLPYFQCESHRALIDMSMARLPDCKHEAPFPLLILGGEHDNLFPPHLIQATGCHFGINAHIMKGVGHLMMLEEQWQEVASTLLDWLESLPDDLE